MKTFEIFVIDVPALIKARQAAAHGFKTEAVCVQIIEHTLKQMNKESMECVCRDCTALMDGKFTMPKAFALCIPMFPVIGDDGVSCAICDSCVDRPDLIDRLVDSMRQLCPNATFVRPGERKQ